MEQLDRNLQRRVWNRVYDKGSLPLTPRQRQALRQSLARSRENLTLYEKMEHHGIYGDAFAKLRSETAEHIKMLQQAFLYFICASSPSSTPPAQPSRQAAPPR